MKQLLHKCLNRPALWKGFCDTLPIKRIYPNIPVLGSRYFIRTRRNLYTHEIEGFRLEYNKYERQYIMPLTDGDMKIFHEAEDRQLAAMKEGVK